MCLSLSVVVMQAAWETKRKNRNPLPGQAQPPVSTPRASEVYSVCRLTPNVRATSAFGIPISIITRVCSTS